MNRLFNVLIEKTRRLKGNINDINNRLKRRRDSDEDTDDDVIFVMQQQQTS